VGHPPRSYKKREAMKTTEGDEMQRFRLLETFQAARHEAIVSHNRALSIQ